MWVVSEVQRWRRCPTACRRRNSRPLRRLERKRGIWTRHCWHPISLSLFHQIDLVLRTWRLVGQYQRLLPRSRRPGMDGKIGDRQRQQETTDARNGRDAATRHAAAAPARRRVDARPPRNRRGAAAMPADDDAPIATAVIAVGTGRTSHERPVPLGASSGPGPYPHQP